MVEIFRAPTKLPIWVLITLILPASADWRVEIGFTRLQQIAASELPGAPSRGFTQVESPLSASYAPDTGNPVFSGKTFLLKSGTSGVSSHADHVARNFYGVGSQQPGTAPVDLYNVSQWASSGFLNLGIDSLPLVEPRAVQNHSWVGSLGNDVETGRRIDFAINRDGFVCVVGVNNESINPLPSMLCQAYHTLSVGRDDGNHSAGLTTIDGAGRIKPDIVAPSADPEYATSWTTPMVAGTAGLLHAKLAAAPISLSGADLPRVIKALLLASATKDTVPDWNHSPSAPLDNVYGAGELNAYHAYSTLRSGRAAASNSVKVPARGWAAEAVSSKASKTYYFTIPAGATATPFCAALTWHRVISKTFFNIWSATLADLNLRFYHANGFTLGSEIAASTSTVDNVELIHHPALAAGTYALVVQSTASAATPYALAWHSLPTVSVAATLATAREIDGQSGLVTVTRSGDTSLPLWVPLMVSGSAISGSHFQPLPASVTIPAGAAAATLAVIPITDALAQGDRSLVVGIAADFALVRDPAKTAVVTIQDKPFDAWRFANFTGPELLVPAISAELADPDADHLANLLEYALGLAPKSTSSPPLAMIDLGGYLALSAAKNPAATDITWAAQVAGDLLNWQPAVVTTQTADAFVARDTVQKASALRRFIRLQITR